jgi:hypothetical protein
MLLYISALGLLLLYVICIICINYSSLWVNWSITIQVVRLMPTIFLLKVVLSTLQIVEFFNFETHLILCFQLENLYMVFKYVMVPYLHFYRWHYCWTHHFKGVLFCIAKILDNKIFFVWVKHYVEINKWVHFEYF